MAEIHEGAQTMDTTTGKKKVPLRVLIGRHLGYLQDQTVDGDEPGDEPELETFEYEMPSDKDGKLDKDGLKSEDFDLEGTLAQAEAAFKAEFSKGSDAALELIEQFAADIEMLREEQGRREEVAAETARKIAAAAEKLALADEADEADAEAEAEAEADDDEADDDEAAAEPEAEAEAEAEPEAMAAGGTRVATRTRTRPRTVAPPAAETHEDIDDGTGVGWTLVAAGGQVSDGVGTRIDKGKIMPTTDELMQLGAEAQRLHRPVLGKGREGDVIIGQFQLSVEEDHEFTSADHLSAFEQSLDRFRQAPKASDFDENGALTAGAACSIVERDYSLYEDWRVGSTFMLEDRVLPRGAIELWEPGTDLCDIIDALETNVSADTETNKAVVTLACPTAMPTCGTSARYLIMERDNFRDRSDQGEYAHEIRKHLAGHQINQHLDHLHTVLNDASTTLKDLTLATPKAQYPDSVEKGLWVQLARQAASLRNLYCLPSDYALDAVIPTWIPMAIRSACAREYGVKVDQVTEGMIRAQFAEHLGASVQMVDWWQRLSTSGNEFPNYFDTLLMPQGAWFNGTQGTLNLGEVRDSVQNTNNKYTTFTEDFYQACRRKYGSYLVRVNSPVTGHMPERVENPAGLEAGVDSTVRPSFA